jgi:hypothetical protein
MKMGYTQEEVFYLGVALASELSKGFRKVFKVCTWVMKMGYTQEEVFYLGVALASKLSRLSKGF